MPFLTDRVQTEGLTFDDVLLIPGYSEVLPREVSIASRFSRNVQINTPIISAAMDTVTEADMAIAIARAGGIGVIHKNMTIAEQAAQVRKVKRAENGMIYDPITIGKDNTVGDALVLMKENRIGGIPVVMPDNTLIGIVTNRDLRFQRDMSRRIEDHAQSRSTDRFGHPVAKQNREIAGRGRQQPPDRVADLQGYYEGAGQPECGQGR